MLRRASVLQNFCKRIAARFFPIKQQENNCVSYARMEYMTVSRTPFGPPINRSMRELDREFFHRTVPLKAAILRDPRLIGRFSKLCIKDILQVSGVPHVITKEEDQSKGILLAPNIENFESLSQPTAEFINENKDSISLEDYELKLNYKYWKSEEILSAILPQDLLDEIPSGFTVVGDIAHMNIRDNYLPYKKLIGTVVHDKNPSIRMVVNKLDTIDTKFRTFDMEIIAATPGLDNNDNFLVEHHESDCRFRFDFRKVYWNSRLHTEHDRLINKFHPGQAVCDVFAGVGPFAIPAGKKNVVVFANDLNPMSYAALVDNIALNKVDQFVKPYCQDGAHFIKHSVEYLEAFADQHPELLVPLPRIKRRKDTDPIRQERIIVPHLFSHYVMNLPDSAITFLGAFIGLLKGRENQIDPQLMPFIHVHCFHKYTGDKEPTDDEIYQSLNERISKELQYQISLEELSFHFVRKVAPTKLMYCVSFRLPDQVAFR